MPRCSDCNYPLACRHCGAKITLQNQRVYEEFYESVGPVSCPHCQEILTCKYCGYRYDVDDYEDEKRQHTVIRNSHKEARMKHHKRDRPIGKCRGCELNMQSFCAAGLEPKSEWSHGRCPLRKRVPVESPLSTGAKAARQQRRIQAVQQATKTHFDGFVYPSHSPRTSSLR